MFGSDNKDKLRENMEEIKQMVEEGETMNPSDLQGQAESAPEEPDFEESQENISDEVEDFSQELEEEFQKQNQDEEAQNLPNNSAPERPQSEHPQQDQDAERQDDMDLQQRPPETEQKHSERQAPERGPQRNQPKRQSGQRNPNRQDSREGNKREKPNTRGLEADIPEPAQTREISVPEIDKGPLFIRREKFEQAVHLIQEMRYISEQIESTVNTIEDDLQRDQSTEKQVKELLHGFDEDRKDVERIVSPKES